MPGMRGRATATLVAIVVVCSLATPATAATVFGRARRISTPYAWNPGKSLAATSNKLLTIFASDCPPPSGRCADDNGPRMGVFVRRSPASSQAGDWSKPLRISPPAVQAERPSIASHGATVIASYVTQRSYLHYRPRAPRVLWIRVSLDQGRTWHTPVRLSAHNGRVDYPRVAIGGGRMFVVWTQADSGAIRMATSDDRGHHWSTATIGSTTWRSSSGEGFRGLPDIGVSGVDVAVAWFSTGGGAQEAVTSNTGGDDLATATPVALTGPSPNDGQHYPAVSGAVAAGDPRVALAYSTNSGLDLRIFDGSSLSAPSTVFTWKEVVDGTGYLDGYGPAVLPFGTSQVAVAIAGCRRNPGGQPCRPLARGARIDMLYRHSADNGGSWAAAVLLTHAGPHPSYRVNDEPSLAVTGSTERVSYDRYQRSFSSYDVWMRSSH
jgi:hypothetical protein